MRIENGSLGAALCVMLACLGAACSSDGARTVDPASGGASSSAGAPVATGGSGSTSSLAGAPGLAGMGTGGSFPLAGSGGMSESGGSTNANGGAPVTGTAGNPNGGAGGAPVITHPKQRTVGYLPSYRGSLSTWATQLDFSLVSYVDLCFASVDAGGNVSYPDAGLSAFVNAAHAKGGKVCLALGGATTITDLGTLGTNITPANRAAFIAKITSYAMTTGLDCIDIDFEGNGVNGDYEGFVTALGPALKAQGKEMSAALGSWFGEKVTTTALQAFDFVNVMAYDIHNPGGSAAPVQSSSLEDSKKEVEYWIGRGLAKPKAIFGVPFYGYRWKPGATSGEAVVYSELLTKYGAAAANDQISQDGLTIFLNGKATIQAKAQAARQYGGVMVWELGQDAAGQNSLLRALNEAP